ncbi:hypothetical protein BH23BAC3_BH23BAC3_04050 [soil metagenome]
MRYKNMRLQIISISNIAIATFILTLVMIGCSEPGTGIEDILNGGEPAVTKIFPAYGETNIARDQEITVTFGQTMDPSSINDSTFVVSKDTSPVQGIIEYSGTTATFTPFNTFDALSDYTAKITTGVRSVSGGSLAADKVWSFTTGGSTERRESVKLGTARNYVILAKSAIENNPESDITGDLGLSPADTSSIIGFDLTDASSYATSTQVSGRIYASNMSAPTPANLAAAIEDMITAYDDAAGRTEPDFIDLHNADVGGRTLSPGVYKWNNSLNVSSDIFISGDSDDVWIFQINENLTISSNVEMTLSGGARTRNIFWQVGGEVISGTGAHFEGIILSNSNVTMNANASHTGRILGQDSVILDSNAVSQPR